MHMSDVQGFVKSMKLTWLKRFITSNAVWAQLVAKEMPDIQDMLFYGTNKLQKSSIKIENPFWKDVIEAFTCFTSMYNPGMPHILTESIWFSDYTKFKCSIIHNWNKKGVRFVSDLVDENTGELHTKETLEKSYEIKMTFLCYESLVRSLPDCVKQVASTKALGPIIPLRMNLVMNHPNFPRLAYYTYLESRQSEITETSARQK